MPKLQNRLPKKCRDRNQCFSWHNGKRIYHGVWASPEADASYKRFIATLLANPTLPHADRDVRAETCESDTLIAELCDAFLQHREPRLDKSHVLHFRRAIGFLVDMFGNVPVDEFSPKKLKICRSQMVNVGTLCRKSVNDYVRRIISIFAWGVEEETVNPIVVHALREVKALQKGEPGTFDNPPRQEVSDDVVKRTLPFMSPTVAAMTQVQRLSGMRPSEIYRMTVEDIDQTRDTELWYYVPKSHKTERFIGEKPIPLGKPEQELIAPYLVGKKASEAIFSPKTAILEHFAARRASRKTKIQPSQLERDRRNASNPSGRAGDFYDNNSYRTAISHAIQKGNRAGEEIPAWTPYMLRHAAGTDAEKTGGLDHAQALLGHKTANVTKRYAHGQLAIASQMARERKNPFADASEEGKPAEPAV